MTAILGDVDIPNGRDIGKVHQSGDAGSRLDTAVGRIGVGMPGTSGFGVRA
jgi:hypothetical protein